MSDYSETFTKVDGNTIEAADFETEFQAIETAIATKVNVTNPVLDGAATGSALARGALVYMTADQTLTTATYTPIQFDAETYDTDTIHDNSTNNTRLTVPAGVTKVRLSGQVMWPNAINATGVYAGLRKNGSGSGITNAAGFPFSKLTGGAITFDSNRFESAILTVTASDYFELIAYHNTGSNVDVDAVRADLGDTWFAMEVIK